MAFLAALLLLALPTARGACPEEPLVALEAHTAAAVAAWDTAEEARFSEVHEHILADLACLAGSGLSTRDADLFLVLAKGAFDAGDEPRALAAARAWLVVTTGPPTRVAAGSPLAALLDRAATLGPDPTGFRALYLGQPPVPSPVDPERERLLAEVRARIELDRRGRRVGTTCAVVGAMATGLSLSILAARATTGEAKDLPPMIQREAMGAVWSATAIAGGLTLGFGIWMRRQADR
jgi:hypothetical protein